VLDSKFGGIVKDDTMKKTNDNKIKDMIGNYTYEIKI